MKKSHLFSITLILLLLITSCRLSEYKPADRTVIAAPVVPGEDTIISLGDGAAISIPEESINNPVTVTIERNPVKSTTLPPIPEGFTQVGDFYNFEITAGELIGPVDLTMPFDDKAIPDGDVVLFVLIPTEEGWEGKPVQPNNNTITYTTNNLGDPLIAWHFYSPEDKKLCDPKIFLSADATPYEFRIDGRLNSPKDIGEYSNNDTSGIDVTIGIDVVSRENVTTQAVVQSGEDGYFNLVVGFENSSLNQDDVVFIEASARCDNWYGLKVVSWGSYIYYNHGKTTFKKTTPSSTNIPNQTSTNRSGSTQTKTQIYLPATGTYVPVPSTQPTNTTWPIANPTNTPNIPPTKTYTPYISPTKTNTTYIQPTKTNTPYIPPIPTKTVTVEPVVWIPLFCQIANGDWVSCGTYIDTCTQLPRDGPYTIGGWLVWRYRDQGPNTLYFLDSDARNTCPGFP